MQAPDNVSRFELRRLAAGEDRAEYAATALFAGGAAQAFRVRVDASGATAIERASDDASDEPDPAVVKFVDTLAKLAARQKGSSGRWPHLLRRWGAAP
jgi:hypothetical protein